ncbi:response regulator [Cohnella lupini]|uniref:Two-component system response regulator YesN n=1 Tax=Cohnella lupini TaxID=1294267 RepID=A0A3D9IQE4_9BACL|nr:response regulator [Cohnella lupini]RED63972.1 two-component system response regulator YesN [Cohnella lupini]
MIEILLVDDESYVTESLYMTIPWEQLNAGSVFRASSGEEALRILDEQDIDIVVTDIRMPEMDGLQLVQEVTRRWPNIRCMLLTGHSDFEYAKRAIQLQVFDYILKPVDDEEFMTSVANAVDSLRDEWAEADEVHRMVYAMKTDRSALKDNLMRDLALGKQGSRGSIEGKLKQYEIPLKVGDMSFMMLVQLGKQFANYDAHSFALMEYAVGNIAEEVFASRYRIWHSKAPHDCLVLLATLKEVEAASGAGGDIPTKAQLEPFVEDFHRQVRTYLKGEISTVVTHWFVFPDELSTAYRSALTTVYQHGRSMTPAVIFQEDLSAEQVSVKSLESLYRPPTLIHLLESKQWDAARNKINEVFDALEKMPITREHLYEALLSMTNAYLYIAHKQGVFIHQINEAGLDPLLDPTSVHSPEKLRSWAVDMLDKLRLELSESDRYTKSHIVKQVQELVTGDTGHETSVKTIADKVFLHPVYLSKIYKIETGESLGDYIIRIRMEKALYLLKHTNKKIYEITTELGYQNPQYFSKMFKKHYGMTPNEYRDQ